MYMYSNARNYHRSAVDVAVSPGVKRSDQLMEALVGNSVTNFHKRVRKPKASLNDASTVGVHASPLVSR